MLLLPRGGRVHNGAQITNEEHWSFFPPLLFPDGCLNKAGKFILHICIIPLSTKPFSCLKAGCVHPFFFSFSELFLSENNSGKGNGLRSHGNWLLSQSAVVSGNISGNVPETFLVSNSVKRTAAANWALREVEIIDSNTCKSKGSWQVMQKKKKNTVEKKKKEICKAGPDKVMTAGENVLFTRLRNINGDRLNGGSVYVRPQKWAHYWWMHYVCAHTDAFIFLYHFIPSYISVC